jgi:hypothetical protein
MTLAAFLLIVSLVPVCAQRAARSSGGSHGGFSGGHASVGASHGSFGGHSGFVGHGSGGPGFGGSHGGSHFTGGSRSFGRGDHFRNGRFGGFRNRCIGCYGYGYGYGYPFYAYGGIDPYWWWDSPSFYDQDLARDREQAAEMNQQNLQEQQMLRQQDHDPYARPMNQPRGVSSVDERAKAEPATVLIFRDQHQRDIQNYAIVDEILWIFTPQRIEKIPLAILNVPATIRANEDRGVEFRLPEASQGQ